MTATLFDGCTVTVEFSLSDAPFTASPSWTDISDYVQEIQISRGRQSELTSYSSGTMTLTLKNADRRFDPEHGSSPYAAGLIPMRHVRVRATYNAVTYDLYRGYILGWPQAYDYPRAATTTVQCVDAFRLFQKLQMPSPLEQAVRADSPVQYWPLDDGYGGATFTRDATGNDRFGILPDNVIQTVDPVAPFGGDGGVTAELSDFNTANNAYSGTFDVTTVEFWLSANDFTLSDGSVQTGPQVYVTTANQVVGAVVDQTAGSSTSGYFNLQIGWWTSTLTLPTINLWFSLRNDNETSVIYTYPYYIQHNSFDARFHIVIQKSGSDVNVYVNGVLAGTATLAAGGTSMGTGLWTRCYPAVLGIAHLAVYTSALTTAQMGKHFAAGLNGSTQTLATDTGSRLSELFSGIGWPSGLTSIGTGSTNVDASDPPTGSVLAFAQKMEEIEQGRFFISGAGVATFRSRTWSLSASAAKTSAATFGDASPDLPYADLTFDGKNADGVAALVSVVRDGGGKAQRYDVTAVDSLEFDRLQIAGPVYDLTGAGNLAEWTLRQRKDGKNRARMTLSPRRSPSSLFPQALGRELGERVTVKRTPQSVGSAINKAMSIEGIQHRIDKSTGVFETSWYLVPAVTTTTDGTTWFTIGDATYGRLGAAAGNMFPG